MKAIRLRMIKLFKKKTMVKIQFIKSPVARYRLGYHCGEEGLFPIDKAIELIAAGYAVIVPGNEDLSTSDVLKRIGKHNEAPATPTKGDGG